MGNTGCAVRNINKHSHKQNTKQQGAMNEQNEQISAMMGIFAGGRLTLPASQCHGSLANLLRKSK